MISKYKTLKKIIDKRLWFWDAVDLFRYDLPRFFRNLWLFRKNLWNHTWYNGSGSILPWVKTVVDDMAWRLEKNGNEVEKSRLKKVAKIRRLSYLIDICLDDKYIDIAEEELGNLILRDWEFIPVEGMPSCVTLKDNETPEEKEHNSKIFKRAREIQKQHWDEICQIIKGPDYDEMKKSDEDFDELYDGSDIRAWWD